jgi:hypothetical protein
MRTHFVKLFALAAAASIAVKFSTFAGAGEIGWIEKFALATDRTVPLEQLIPGTEDYYYYHALHYQSTEQWGKVEPLLKAWVERYNWTGRALEVQNRQALLTYKQDPQPALELIRRRLNLHFNQQPELINQKPNLPTRLDAALLSRQQLDQQALAQFPNTLQGFENAALDRLVNSELNADQRRQLLSRLERPDYPNLAKLVVADLNYKDSGGFGQFEIHRRLLLSQLDECAKLKPELIDQVAFINDYLLRLHPSDDVNWRQNAAALRAYLERLWKFVALLDPVHNSLKAHVLYHWLLLDRSQGKYDAERFLEYIKLPKHVGYVAPRLLEHLEVGRAANLTQDFAPATMLPPVGDDEPLIRSYLAEFFLTADDYSAYANYIQDQYLKQVFAETKIVNGLGDAEKWYSLLPPAVYQQLKQRIDIDFAFTNRTELSADDPVGLDVYVKNVETLIVKVFEINAQNFYRQSLQEISTDINLDGLVANQEKTYTYQEPPLRRVKRHFDFPALSERGVYVVDFIGNGKASRALIRKGQLRYLVQTSAAGHVFTVLDEQKKPAPAATLWLAGTLFKPDKDGTITVPFSAQPGRRPIVLALGRFASLDHFEQVSESYQLTAAMYVDREQLIARRNALLLVRPRLLLAGTPVSRKVLEDVRLSITSTDLDNVTSTKEVADFKLHDDRESVWEFPVPQRLATIRFQLKAKVQNQSQNQKQDLALEQIFSLNEIDRTDKTEDLHFSRATNDYQIDLLGKTGEAKADRPLQLVLKLRDYTQTIPVSLQTNAAGRVLLGPLPGVTSITATGPQGTAHTWNLRDDQHTYPQSINGNTDAPFEVPYMGAEGKPERTELSLLELRGDKFLSDRFANLAVDGGLLRIGKLPPGDYSLLVKRSATQIRLRVAEGKLQNGYILGDYRQLELRNSRPLQLKAVEVTDKTVRVQLQNAGKLARVHVFATRFQPAYSAYGNLAGIRPVEPYVWSAPRPESQYVAGRNIGDEYRYIIDRKFARKYPGNMLERPSLLLNPWAIRSTQTGQQEPQRGSDFEKRKQLLGAAGGRAADLVIGPAVPSDFADLDFLGNSSLVLANVEPDESSAIELQRADLSAYQELLFVAVDSQNTASRIVALPAAENQYLDLRLAKSLDPQQHYTQQRRISIVPAQGRFVVADITSTHFEVYDSLARVYSLYAALNSDPKLLEFEFVRNWPSLSIEDKRAKYLKYASHELHFFLYQKDPAFFKQVVRPYLANKKEKRFLDRWLLDDDLQVYLKPWNFEQLNTLEKILLAQRIEGQRAVTARLIKDRFDLIPSDAERFNHLFQTALKAGSLEPGGGNLGIQAFFETGGLIPKDGLANGFALPAAPAAGEEAEKSLELPMDLAAGAKSNSRSYERLGRADKKMEMQKRLAELGDEEAADRDMDTLDASVDDFAFAADMLGKVQQYYRKLDKTMEWVESNYYQLPLEQQNAALIAASGFWKDYALHDPAQPFFSTNLAEASRNFPEMLAALSLIDLPFDPAQHKTEFKGTEMTLTAGSPVVVYHEEIQPAAKVAEKAPILVSENFFRNGDRYRQVGGEQIDKFISDEFLYDTVYGCHIVVTNPTSSKKRVDILLQIPAGALPVAGGQYTRSVHIDLEPYHTQTLEYYFYFPAPGKYPHYPVQVAANGEVLAFAAASVLNVVKELTNIDKESWDYLSQHGSAEDVLTFLEQQNILRVDLDRIAWRMKDKDFFQQTIKLLASRHVYNNTLWSFGVRHNDIAAIRQFLQFADEFVRQTGDWLDSPLLTIDPVVRNAYEQMDYRPLVNARVGQLGREREILNDRFLAHYQQLLKILSYRRQLDDGELMAVTYYLLLQDRVDEALDFFARVNVDRLATRLQYDYFAAYLDFCKSEPKQARQIAARYLDYPVDRWQAAFANIVNQADEIGQQDSKLPDPKVADPEDRSQLQTSEAAATPSFEFTVEGKKVKLNFQRLTEVRVNYYLMDIELLFSRSPFVQGESKQFSHILPNQTRTIKLPPKGSTFDFSLPDNLVNANLLIEIVGGGLTQSQAYYSGALQVQVIENYGQVRVTQGKPSAPLAKVYVKAYARMQDGNIRFYKDGYTDLRGRFDYTSLNTNELEFVEKFSLLILSDEHGAVVREAKPPKR